MSVIAISPPLELKSFTNGFTFLTSGANKCSRIGMDLLTWQLFNPGILIQRVEILVVPRIQTTSVCGPEAFSQEQKYTPRDLACKTHRACNAHLDQKTFPLSLTV
jgi:hypothetical protein